MKALALCALLVLGSCAPFRSAVCEFQGSISAGVTLLTDPFGFIGQAVGGVLNGGLRLLCRGVDMTSKGTEDVLLFVPKQVGLVKDPAPQP